MKRKPKHQLVSEGRWLVNDASRPIGEIINQRGFLVALDLQGRQLGAFFDMKKAIKAVEEAALAGHRGEFDDENGHGEPNT